MGDNKRNREDFLKSFGHSILAGIIEGKKDEEASVYIQYQQCKKGNSHAISWWHIHNYINNFILKSLIHEKRDYQGKHTLTNNKT